SMVEDYEGYLWVGTMYGLYKLSRNEDGLFSYKLYRQDIENEGFISNNIQYIYEDSHKNLWFGTTDSGLILKEKQSSEFKAFQKKDGLLSNTVRSVTMDSIGNIWLGGNRGLSKLNLLTNTFTNYDKLDGLTSNNFND